MSGIRVTDLTDIRYIVPTYLLVQQNTYNKQADQCFILYRIRLECLDRL